MPLPEWYIHARLWVQPHAIIEHPEWEASFDFHATLPFVFEKQKLLVMASPKAGITSISKWAFHNLGLLEAAMAHHRWIHKYRTDVYPQKFGVRKAFVRLLQDPETQIVKIIRNPHERLVSMFYHAVKHQLLPHLGDYHFTTFVQHLLQQPAKDPHLQPQFSLYEALIPNLKPTYIKLEALASGFQVLSERYGFSLLDPRMTESPHHIPKKNIQYQIPLHLVSGSMLLQDFPSNYSGFFSDEALNAEVQKLLALDLSHYGSLWN
jgi:hypothetical protein